jgi:hypothetical protein
MAKRTVLSSVLSVIEKADGAEFDRIDQGKHAKVRWRYKGQTLTTVCPCTASDHRSEKNAVALVRRQMREIDNEHRGP